MTLEKITKNKIIQMPGFIHEFGDEVHHLCPAGYSRSNLIFIRHECLDVIFYFLRRRILGDLMGDAHPTYHVLNAILGFFWGLNCGFPGRDVALFTVWDLRGCKPVSVWERRNGEWVRTKPADSRRTVNGVA